MKTFLDGLRIRPITFYGTCALMAAVLAFGAWKDLSTPERRAAMNASAATAQVQESIQESAVGLCQQAVTEYTKRSASLGWPASARMPGGEVMVKQPYALGSAKFEARCTLDTSGTFKVLMDD